MSKMGSFVFDLEEEAINSNKKEYRDRLIKSILALEPEHNATIESYQDLTKKSNSDISSIFSNFEVLNIFFLNFITSFLNLKAQFNSPFKSNNP